MLRYLNWIASPTLALPRAVKMSLALVVDVSFCFLTVWFALYLRLGIFVSLSGPSMLAALVSVCIAIPIFVLMGLYRAIFRYSGWPALLTVLKASAVYALVYTVIFTAIGIEGVPRTLGLIQPILLLLTVGASRLFVSFWLGGAYQNRLRQASLPRVLIYGAGSSGRQLATAMSNSHEMVVLGFLDDNEQLHGHILNGLLVHAPSDLGNLIATRNISSVLLALPSTSRNRRNEILAGIRSAHVSVRTLPSMTELAQGKIRVSDLRELDIDDLLGRDPVVPDQVLLSKNIRGKTVLVTGAGGSIGSELCRQILSGEPARLLLVELSEFALYAIHQELLAIPNGTTKLVPLLASVRDESRMSSIMSTWKPDTVYHSAAYKHVPLVEHNPAEGVRNNVIGTMVAARVAQAQGVSDFVLISTDKAVRPTNIMGASKRLAEMVLQALAEQSDKTTFTMVRFGNVLGSSGSVVPKFRQQIHDGGPITLTHADITRYFMTIPEAAQLVIQAGAMAKGGDVFVLDMGKSIRIVDLARRMVELSGLTVRDKANPDGEIEIEITGLRPGEKLFEELLIGENPEPTSHPRIMKAREDFLSWKVLDEKIQNLEEVLHANDIPAACVLLKQVVSGYVPSGRIVDWVFLANESEVK